jgi:hypothetical protein
MTTTNAAEWIKTDAIGALHALVGGTHFVVTQDTSWITNPARLYEVSELAGECFGRFATIEEAKACVHGYAMAKTGSADIGVLGDEWGR